MFKNILSERRIWQLGNTKLNNFTLNKQKQKQTILNTQQEHQQIKQI